MKSNAFAALFLLFVCLIASSFAVAQTPPRDAAKEEKLSLELEKTAPKAVETFRAATAALDQDKHEEAARLYAEVLKQSPNFEPALRRGGLALISAGRREEGLKMNYQAVALNRSPENLVSYAFALTEPGARNYQATKSDLEQAFGLSKEAMQRNPDDPDYALATAQYALATENLPEFNKAVKILNEKSPELSATHFFNGLRLANDGDLDGAEDEIRTAERLGMPAETTKNVLTAIETEKGNRYFGLGNYFYYGGILVGLWALGLVGLFVAGKILSAMTLCSLENSDPNDIHGAEQAGLRGIYKKVITAAGVYYYLSQPVVMLLILGAAGRVVLFFFWLGRIPIKLVAVVAIIALVTVFYMVKSLLIRAKPEDPGRALSESEAPELWRLVREVARTINTRPVSEIRITHGTELAVYERGGVVDKMQDKAERILIIGLATLNGFDQNAFRAVLAHEYGHFSNRDTAGGDIAMRVEMDMINLANSMIVSETATFYNIAFHFVRFYHFIFRRITHGASRLQEIMADRVAAYHYGTAAFREGLTHVIRRDLEFSHVAETEINAAMGGGRALQNLYDMTVEDEGAKKSIDQQFGEYLGRPTTEDDTHPSPSDRFRMISRMQSRQTAPLAGEVWDLFRDKAALTREMNDYLESRLRSAM